jgi:hypothetical protein
LSLQTRKIPFLAIVFVFPRFFRFSGFTTTINKSTREKSVVTEKTWPNASGGVRAQVEQDTP